MYEIGQVATEYDDAQGFSWVVYNTTHGVSYKVICFDIDKWETVDTVPRQKSS